MIQSHNYRIYYIYLIGMCIPIMLRVPKQIIND